MRNLNLSRKQVAYCGMLICIFVSSRQMTCAQAIKPGLSGMAPSKWITIRNTQAPGRVYSAEGNGAKTYTQEDIYIKAWIPVIHKTNYAILLGPQYRTEQLEFQSDGENPLHQLSNWNLRSMGLDIRSCFKVDSAAFMMVGFNMNQSGNLRDQPHSNVPINYTITSVYLKKKSANKEIGFGFMANKSFNSMTVLPIFVMNYNYSSKGGLEIMLPYKITWRNNLSPTDILYVKTEAVTRSYWINGSDQAYAFRRTEIDMGVAYNKAFNKMVGVELFGGYRKNISCKLPSDVTAIKSSGLVFSMELYLRSPF